MSSLKAPSSDSDMLPIACSIFEISSRRRVSSSPVWLKK